MAFCQSSGLSSAQISTSVSTTDRSGPPGCRFLHPKNAARCRGIVPLSWVTRVRPSAAAAAARPCRRDYRGEPFAQVGNRCWFLAKSGRDDELVRSLSAWRRMLTDDWQFVGGGAGAGVSLRLPLTQRRHAAAHVLLALPNIGVNLRLAPQVEGNGAIHLLRSEGREFLLNRLRALPLVEGVDDRIQRHPCVGHVIAAFALLNMFHFHRFHYTASNAQEVSYAGSGRGPSSSCRCRAVL
jgi:hypothetical protein